MSQPHDPIDVDPVAAFQALQEFASREIARLYGEIAARDAYIAALKAPQTQTPDSGTDL